MSDIINCLKKILIQVDKWGDMLKSVYDPDADGVVADSDKLEGKTLAEVRNHVAPDSDKLQGSTKAEVQNHTPKPHTLASHSTKAHSELTGVSANQHHTEFTIAEHDTTTRHPVAVIKTSQGSTSGTLPPSNWALITMNVKSFFPGLSTPSGILHGYIMIGSQAASYTSQFAIYNDPACPPGAHDYDIRWYYLS